MSGLSFDFEVPCKYSFPKEACEQLKFTGTQTISTTLAGESTIKIVSLMVSTFQGQDMNAYSRTNWQMQIYGTNLDKT